MAVFFHVIANFADFNLMFDENVVLLAVCLKIDRDVFFQTSVFLQFINIDKWCEPAVVSGSVKLDSIFSYFGLSKNKIDKNEIYYHLG